MSDSTAVILGALGLDQGGELVGAAARVVRAAGAAPGVGEGELHALVEHVHRSRCRRRRASARPAESSGASAFKLRRVRAEVRPLRAVMSATPALEQAASVSDAPSAAATSTG